MLQIQNNVIRMTKGDSGAFQIEVRRSDGRIYKLSENDMIVFYLNRYDCSNQIIEHSPLIVKTFQDNNIKIESIDTKFLKEGEYYWKCELRTFDGEINSICGGLFILTCVAGG